MDAIIMLSTDWLIPKLQADYPQITFCETLKNSSHRWSPTDDTVYYPVEYETHQLLHEVGHALLHHTNFLLDINLLEMERHAWQYARNIIAPRYNLTIPETVIETALDSYRDWLHARSLCPSCESNGIQAIDTKQYNCLNCQTEWRSSDGRRRGLKRYIVT